MVRPLQTDFDVVNMVATLPRNHHIHVYLKDKVVLYGGNGDNPDNEPPIQVALDTGSELEMQNEPEARDEGYSSTGLDIQGDDSDSFDSDFHESVFDIEKDDDHVHEGIVDFEIESDMGSGEGCNGGLVDGVSALDILYGVRRVGSEDVNEDGSEYAPSSSLHSVHESDFDDVSQWSEFNNQTDMMDPHFKKGMLLSNREVLKEVIRKYGIKNRYNLKLERNDKKIVKAVCKVGCPWSL